MRADTLNWMRFRDDGSWIANHSTIVEGAISSICLSNVSHSHVYNNTSDASSSFSNDALALSISMTALIVFVRSCSHPGWRRYLLIAKIDERPGEIVLLMRLAWLTKPAK